MARERLKTDLWVGAYLRRLELANIPAYVTRRGQPDLGAVMVKCATLDGRATLWARQMNLMTGASGWQVLAEGPEPEVDASAAKQRSFDPDLWLIEIESREGRTLLNEEGFSD